MTPIYIFGHQKPDTDSIASVIGYAEYRNRSEPGRYIPARCGDLNPETRYMLDRFGLENPAFIPSVEPRLSDITYKPVFSLPADVPTVDVATLMAKEAIRNVVIIDPAGKPVGMVGEHALAAAYLRKIHLAELAVTPAPVETLARILNAEIIVSSHAILEGRVYIAIDALHVTLAKMTAKDIAVVGDDEPAQLAFIAAGIACLILAEGAPAGGRVIAAAEKKGVSVLTTPLDAFGVGKMINLSLPAREVMEQGIPVLALTDTLARARLVVSGSKFRAACVVRPDGTLAGVLTRTTLLDEVRRSIILLDHNEASQAVDGIGEAEIIEIIDHHRLSPITTLKPVKFLNDPVGATSTIIAMKFAEAGLVPSPGVAGGSPLRYPLRHPGPPHVDNHPPRPDGGEVPISRSRGGTGTARHRAARTGYGSLGCPARHPPCTRYQGVRTLEKKSDHCAGDGAFPFLELRAEHCNTG